MDIELKKILEDFKYKYFSPFVGNDVVEMNSIISKYIAAATFDIKHTDLINLLFRTGSYVKITYIIR